MPLATARIADYPLVRVGAALPLADPTNLSGSVAQGIERPPPKRQVDGSNPSGVTTGVQTQLLFLRPNPDVCVVSWGMRDGRLTGVGARLAGNGRCGPTFAGEYCFQKTGTKLRQAPDSNTNRKRVRVSPPLAIAPAYPARPIRRTRNHG